MPDRDRMGIDSMLEAIDKILEFTKGFTSADEFFCDSKSFDATMMNFIVIGEMIDRISLKTKNSYPAIEWPRIKGFRNLIAHDYFGIDAEEVWQIITDQIPKLRQDLLSGDI